MLRPIKLPLLVFVLISLSPLVNQAQFFWNVMPASVHGGSVADTLLNTRLVLLNAGVKEIHVSNSNPEVTKTFATKTIIINADGRTARIISCNRKNSSTGFVHCTVDTIIYYPDGHIKSMRTIDNANNPPFVYEGVQVSERELKYTFSFAQDSSFSNEIYDVNGRITHYTGNNKSVKHDTRYFYNADGLLDSMAHKDGGTYIFKRKHKRKNKIIELQPLPANTITWEYNSSGQCISYTSFTKYSPGVVFADGYKKDIKSVIRYYYNNDGTLSKVVNESSNKPSFTLSYSYLK